MSPKRGSGRGHSRGGNDLCWILVVNILKLILCILNIVIAIFIIVYMVKIIGNRDYYIEYFGSETQYWINVAALVVSLLCMLILLLLIITEQWLGILITIAFMVAILIYKVVTKNLNNADMSDKINFGLTIADIVLMTVYIILICFAEYS